MKPLIWPIEAHWPRNGEIDFSEVEMTNWEAKLKDFESYEANWDSYNGNPITAPAINSAKLIIPILLALELPVPNVIPMSSGGIALEWHHADNELVIEIGSHGEISSFFLYGNHLTSWELTAPL